MSRIPAEPFVTILKNAVSRVQTSDNYSPIPIVATWADVDEDTLRRMLRGEFKSVEFNMADKLLTALDIGWWEHPALDAQYQEVDLSDTRDGVLDLSCIHGVPKRADQKQVDVCERCRLRQDKLNEQKKARRGR